MVCQFKKNEFNHDDLWLFIVPPLDLELHILNYSNSNLLLNASSDKDLVNRFSKGGVYGGSGQYGISWIG